MWWANELSSSLKFLAIEGDEPFFRSKRVYEIVLPAVGAAALFALYWFVPGAFVSGFLRKYSESVFQFMVFVVPFHLAALAAFATYQATGLDEKLFGARAQLRVWSNQDNDFFYKDLTLRQYVSLLFGYLCSIGIVYVLIFVVVSNINMQALLGGAYNYAYCAAVFISLFFVIHYVVMTVYAITFLFDKVNKVRSL